MFLGSMNYEFCRVLYKMSYSNSFEASDLQKVAFLLQTYSQTGCIILNPCLPKQLIYAQSYPTQFDPLIFSINLGNDFRPACPASQAYWTDDKKAMFRGIWSKNLANSPNTVFTIKALLFLQQYRSDISDVAFLTDLNFIKLLSDAYELKATPQDALNYLKQLKSINVEHTKLEIKTKLLRYIASRGIIEGDYFLPSRSSSIFRDPQVTEFRINLAVRLINKIETLNQIFMIQKKVLETKNWSEEKYPCRFFKSNFSQCMDECLQLISQNDASIITNPNPAPGR